MTGGQVNVNSVSSWVATSKASRESLPGDTLYSVKIASERTQLAWVSMLNDKAKSAQFHVELANRRAEEVKKIVASAPEKKQRVSEIVHTVKQELVAASQKLDDIKNEVAPTLSQAVVTAIKQQTDDVKKTLQETKVTLQTSTTSADKILSEEVADAKNSAKDIDVSTVQAAVADHFKANSAISKDYVNALIDTTLSKTVTETGETKSNVSEVKTLVIEVAQVITSSTVSSTVLAGSLTSTTVGVSTGTLVAGTSTPNTTSTVETLKHIITSVAGEAAQAAVKTDVAADQLAQKVSEVKQLLSNGDLSSAASKIQEVADASKEVEKIADATLVKVQTTIPEVVVAAPTSSPIFVSTTLLKEKIDGVLRTSVASSTGLATGSGALLVSNSSTAASSSEQLPAVLNTSPTTTASKK
jgi:uncharacterized coiled-coil DUF342 family protein